MPFVFRGLIIWTLLEMMRAADIYGLALLLNHISKAMEEIKPHAEGDARDEPVPQDGLEAWAKPNLTHAQIMASHIGLAATDQRVFYGGGPTFFAFHIGVTWQQLYNELKVLRETIEGDLATREFVFILPDRSRLLKEMQATWEPVWKAFPEAKPDIEEMMYCYALERHTATVFHLMRVVEWGLRAICLHLGLKKVKNFIKKSAKVELVPIEYNMWEKLLGQLRGKVNKKISKLQKGSTKQQHQEFYFPVLQNIEDIKDSWRNHVMHTRRSYNGADALAAMSHVTPIMTALAAKGIKTL